MPDTSSGACIESPALALTMCLEVIFSVVLPGTVTSLPLSSFTVTVLLAPFTAVMVPPPRLASPPTTTREPLAANFPVASRTWLLARSERSSEVSTPSPSPPLVEDEPPGVAPMASPAATTARSTTPQSSSGSARRTISASSESMSSTDTLRYGLACMRAEMATAESGSMTMCDFSQASFGSSSSES